MSISKACRKLAMTLAFVMVAGAFAWGPGVELAYAAPGDFVIISRGIIMMAGSAQTGTAPEVISSTNIFREEQRYSEQKKFELMDRLGDLDTQLVTYIDGVVGLTAVEKYEFEHPIGLRRKAHVTLERIRTIQGGGATFKVEYEVRDYTTTPYTVLNDNASRNTFQVYVSPTDGFRNPQDYPLSETVQDLDVWRVHEEPVFEDDGTTPVLDNHGNQVMRKIPEFTISSNQPGYAGFSFKYAGRTVHFLLRDGRFYYATDGIDPGKIYDFDLTRHRQSGAIDPTDTAQYFAYPVPEFTPYSHVGQPGAPGFGYSINAVLPGGLIWKDQISTPPPNPARYLVSENAGLNENIRPGAGRQYLHTKLPYLMQWDKTENRFTTHVTADIELALELYDRQNIITNTKSFRIDKEYLKDSAQSSLALNQIEARNTRIADVVHSAEYFTVVLGDMDPGQLYRVEVKGNTAETNIETRTTYLEYGSAYTLMEHTFVGETMIIWPYKDVQGTYVIGADSNASFTGNNEHEHFFPPRNVVTTIVDRAGNGEPVARPIPISPDSAGFYRIVFIMEENSNIKILSQASWAQLIPGTGVKTPTEFFVNSDLKRAPDWFTGEKGELMLNLRWDLGEMIRINNLVAHNADRLSLAYDLSRSFVPRDDPGNYSTFADLVLDIVPRGNGLAAENVVVTSPINGLFIERVGNVEITSDFNMITKVDHYYIDVSLKFSANSVSYYSASRMFLYPNIYFMLVKPTHLGGHPLENIGAAPSKSFTIDNLTPPEMGSPQNPRAPENKLVSEVNEAGQIIEASLAYEFAMPDYIRFRDYYRPEIEMEENVEWRFHFYIAQAEAPLRTATYRDTDGVNKPFYKLSPQGKEVAAVAPYTDGSKLYLSSDSSALTISRGANGAHNGKQAREALRDNKIVWIEDVVPAMDADGVPSRQQSFTLDGLDVNQSYYIYSEIELIVTSGGALVFNRPEDSQSQIQRRELIFHTGVSQLVGITTKGLPNAPKPGEKTPVAPTEFGVRDVQDTSTTLEWKGVTDSSGTIEYELLRIRNEQLDSTGKLLTDRSSFPELWEKFPDTLTVKLDAQKNANSNHIMRTNGSDMLRWNPSTGLLEEVNEAFYTFDPHDDGGFMVYEDKTLTPNQVYFYYLRAVKTTDGVETYSNWVHTTLTTVPVKRPADLRIEPPRSGREYDLEKEVMFSFTAEVAPASISSGEFSFWYELKKEGESWSAPIRMTVATLERWVEPIGSTGVYRYVYRVSGLDNGASYTLRVFTQDADGNKSLNSNEVMFKTDFNQDDYNKKEEIDRWKEYFRALLEEALKNPYWPLYDTAGRLEVVYRPTMFPQQITEAMDANINLAQGGISRAIYHIPLSAFTSAENAGKGFRIVLDNVEIIIPSTVIDFNLNSTAIDMASKIRTGTIADYYITLSIDRRYLASVDGLETATQETGIRFNVIESSVLTERWDRDMFNLLAAEVERKAWDAGVLDGLSDRIDDKKTSEEIIKYIESVVDETIRDFSNTLRSEFSRATKSEYGISLDRRFTIIGRNTLEINVGNGYEYVAGAWVQRDTTPYGEGQAMYPAAAGTFIFAGRPTSIPALVGVPDGALMTALIYKYNLEDFFGQISYETLERYANRDMLAGTVARIAGAPRGADSIAWLNQNRQMGLSARNSQAPIEMQEALYIVVSLYGFKTNMPIANIQIRNFAITNNMTGLDNKYRQHVRAAFELGIYTDRNMRPESAVKVREILKILVDLDKRVKL